MTGKIFLREGKFLRRKILMLGNNSGKEERKEGRKEEISRIGKK